MTYKQTNAQVQTVLFALGKEIKSMTTKTDKTAEP
jgi:hypothetical protein